MTGHRADHDSDISTPPAEGTPSRSSHANDHSFTLQAVMEMQRTLGGLATEIQNLTSCAEKNNEAIARLEKKMVVLDTTLKVGGAALGFFLVVFWFVFGEVIVDARDQIVGRGFAQEAPDRSGSPSE